TLVKQATRITFGEKTAPSEVTSDQIGMLAQAVLGLTNEANIDLRDLQTATSSNPGKKQSLTKSIFETPFDELFIPEKVVNGCLFDQKKGVYIDNRGREHHLTINSQGQTFVLVKDANGGYFFKTIDGQDTAVLRTTALGLEQKLISKREFIHLSNIRERRAPESRLNSLMTNMGDFVFNVFQTVANGRNRINVIRRLTQFLTGSREIRITPDHRGLFMHKGRIIKTFTYPHIGQLNWLEGNQYTNESETPVDVSGIELTVTENILTRLRDLIWEMLNKNASSVKVGETSLSAAD
ncbi:hypothetical protein KJ654_04040, partial [Patescibacteria group bacterium]|nr:hypothetical protein [Patescibacteria group bacterium]MBU1967471.1 hypothetical protein [Patescibacteria group bacterium]